MQLQEVFDQLSGGEFSQLSIGGAQAGVIDATNFRKVVGHINLGLTALYRRFNLKEGRLTLEMQADLLDYTLHSRYSITGNDAPVLYIRDAEETPFLDDIIKIEKVLDAEGCELGLNDASDSLSVFTPSAIKLRLPLDLPVQDLTVVYRAGHDQIVLTNSSFFTVSTTELSLPSTHLDALLYYVASRVNNPIGMTNEFHAGNSYAAKYEMVCKELEGNGLQVDLGQGNGRLLRNGWV